MISFLDDVRS